jgi:hypothetical protein
VCLSLNTWSLTPDPGSDCSSPLVLLSDHLIQNFRKKVKREEAGLFNVVHGIKGPLRYFGSLGALLEAAPRACGEGAAPTPVHEDAGKAEGLAFSLAFSAAAVSAEQVSPADKPTAPDPGFC